MFPIKRSILLIIIFVWNCQSESRSQEIKIHIGDLISQKNLNYHYVEGDIINCRNISIEYLKGNIRGEKNMNIHVNIMKGNIISGNVKVNILDGDIINGQSVVVNLLLGKDFSNQAIIKKNKQEKIHF